MNLLVTLEEAKRHLRIDTDGDDPDLQLKVYAASAAVLAYLKAGADAFTDSAGNVIEDSDGPVGVPFQVQAATLLMTGYLYKNRDEDTDKAFQMGYLPAPVMALLYPLRDPSIA